MSGAPSYGHARSHHFLSYSRIDAVDFALELYDELFAGPPAMDVWLDQRRLVAGQHWSDEVEEAIRRCESFIIVLTPEAAERQSKTNNELRKALRYKKPIIPLLRDVATDPPLELEGRQHIDFTGDDLEHGLAELRRRLRQLPKPKGQLQHLKELLGDAQRDLRRNDLPPERLARTERDADEYRRQIAELERVIARPAESRRRVETSIREERYPPSRPETPRARAGRPMVVNAPRFAPPWYFQDRSVEVGLLGDLLRKDEVRLILVAGRGGMGKTTVACRVFAGIERGHLPDGSPFRADGIVYLNAGGFRQLTLRSVLDDLSRLRPPAAIDRLAAVFTSRHASADDKMHALLAELGGMRVLVLLDGLDRLLDPRTLELRDAELQEGLEALLATPEHGVRVVVTTRIPPASLMPVGPGEQRTLDLHLGLESPFAESVLEQLDADGTLGLRSAPPELLSEARRRTRGYPKALEALVNVLRTDRTTTLEDLLADTATVPPDEVQQVLVGESLDRLDPPAERVVRALAVYGRPVPPAAVDYMLLPFQQGLSEPLLERLVSMHLVRVEAGRYFLEPDERSHAYDRIPDGLASDRTERPPPFTKAALLFWGAEYCRHAPPAGGRPSPEDQELSLLEVDLRRRAGDHEEAARLLVRSARRYLLPQGEMALLAQEGQRLEGALPDSSLAYRTIMLLGLALRRLGDHDAAIVRFARARQLARRLGDGLGEKKALTNLATCYFELGRVTEAASWYERAIELARTLEHEDAQAEPRLNLGLCYSQAGDLARAVDHYREGLRIATDASKLGLQSQVLANLGSVQAEMGRPSEALDTLEGGLAIAMQTGEHYVIGRCHGNIAEVLVDRGELDPAADRAQLAADAGERLHRSELACDGYATVALAHLLAGRLAEAGTAIAAAGQFAKGSSRRAPAVFALSGVVALRGGGTEEAYEAFNRALAGTVKLLDNGRNPLPRAFDTQGLARAGMALADDDGGENLREAVRAYEAARSLCRERGLVERTLRLLEQLAVVDGRRLLPPVRAAAAGSDADVHVG